MALTHIAFGFRSNDIPGIGTAELTAETLTPSGSSAATTGSASVGQKSDARSRLARVSTDTAVYVAFGASPTASSTTGFYIPANGVDYFPVAYGDKAAVITA